MEESQLNTRRVIFIWIGIAAALLIIELLWHFYHTGKVIITTDNSHNTISLSRVDNNGQSIGKVTKAHSKLSKTLGTGKYTVSVNGSSVATIQTFTLKPRQTLRYNINPINTSGVEPVVYANAQTLTASAQRLVYLDASSNTLFGIDKQNRRTQLYNNQSFQSVKWADSSFGVGMSNPYLNGSVLYVLNNNSTMPLKLPFNRDVKTSVGFDVATDRSIAVSNGAAVYIRTKSDKFKKIYTASSRKPVLAAGSNKEVAVSDPVFNPPSGASKPLLATVDSSGETHKKGVEAERLAWSPNGQYLATVNQANPTIYDPSLNIVSVITTNSVVGQFTWLNKNTLLYTINDQLWTYSVQAHRAQLLANMPQSSTIQGMYVSSDGAYIYMSTYNSVADNYAIVRMGLHGQKVPVYIYNLQDILPLDESTYFINLVNFSLPTTILVQPYPFSPADNYTQKAQSLLQSRGFNINQLRFQIVPLDANGPQSG